MTGLLLGALACDGEPACRGGGCRADGTTLATVGADNRELGFSAAEAVAFFAGGTGDLVWHDGTTTTVAVSAELAGDSVEIYRWPPGQGYCYPTMTIPAGLRLTTGDGKLDESWPASLIAESDGAAILAVFPGSPPPFSAGLQAVVPAAWRTSGDREGVNVDIVAKQNRMRVYCATGERVSADPADSCNDRDGVLRFFSGPPDLDVPPSVFVIGAWRWRD